MRAKYARDIQVGDWIQHGNPDTGELYFLEVKWKDIYSKTEFFSKKSRVVIALLTSKERSEYGVKTWMVVRDD